MAGQIFSGEFLLGFMLFLAALIVLLNLWDTSTREVFSAESQRTMEELGVDAAEKLVRTPGIPPNWGVWNVTSLGLTNESRVLVPYKIREFTHLMSADNNSMCSLPGSKNYDCNLYLLGIGGYNFYFNLTYLNGSTVTLDSVSCHTGKPPVNDTEKLTIIRTALLNNEITRMYFTVWR